MRQISQKFGKLFFRIKFHFFIILCSKLVLDINYLILNLYFTNMN